MLAWRNRPPLVCHLRSEPLIFKWIYQFCDCYLFRYFIFLQLVRYIFFYLFCIFTYCIYIISSTPKLSISIFIFHICIFWYINKLLLPFRNPTKLATLSLGGISKSICIWSTHTSASIILTPFHSHNCRRIAPISLRLWWNLQNKQCSHNNF